MTTAFDPEVVALLANDPSAQRRIAYIIPMEAFVYKRDGSWCLDEPVHEKGIVNYLITTGETPDEAERILRERDYLCVFGHEMAPWRPAVFASGRDNHMMLNTWVMPSLVPAAGEYPSIRRVIEWLTDGDEAGERWLMHWMGAKIQNPTFVPKVAAVFATQQGGGKGTLAFLMRQMLGPENTAIVQGEELKNKFNQRWATKLFVLADEVLSRDNYKDQSNRLKVLIDGNEIEMEAKYANQKAVKSKLAWMFASNDDVTPVLLEANDRRYSVFANHKDLPDGYAAALNGLFRADRVTPTAAFQAEIAAFCWDLLRLKVDYRLIARPHGNAAREDSIEASRTGHQAFFAHVEEFGLDDLIAAAVHRDYLLEPAKARWDPAVGDIDAGLLYAAYVHYCGRTGTKALKMGNFGAAAKNRPRPFEYVRRKIKGKLIGHYHIPPPRPDPTDPA